MVQTGLLNRVAQPTLAANEILLRRFQADDAMTLYEAVQESVQEIIPWMRWFEGDFSVDQSHEWIEYVQEAWEKKQAYNFVISEEPTGKLLGSVWLSLIVRSHGYANVGYWVRTSCAGHGVATRAVRLLAEFAFGELQLKRLEIVVAVGNHASERVAQKVGAKREGLLRERLQLHGQAKDAIIFGLLSHEYAR